MTRQQDIEKLAKLCGWHKVSHDHRYSNPKALDIWWHWADSGGKRQAGRNFNPWQHWEHAGMVLEALVSNGYTLTVLYSRGTSVLQARWFCYLTGACYGYAGADTGPAAIADAALRVVGDEG